MPVAASQIEIRYRRTDSPGQWTFVKIPAGQDSVQLSGVERGVSYQIEARSIALSGAASDWVAQTHVVSALTVAPLAPTTLAATSLADGVHLTWTASDVQRSDVEYEIQRTADLSGAPDPADWATLNRVRSLRYTDGVTDGIVRWYRVRAATYGGITTAFTSNVSSSGKTVENGATVGMVRNPGFESGDLNWSKGSAFTIVNDPTNAYAGNWVAKYTDAGANDALRNSILVAVQPGDVLVATGMVKRTAGTGSGAVRISWVASNGSTELSDTIGNQITSSTYATSRVVGTAPASAFFARIEGEGFSGGSTICYFDQFDMSLFPKSQDEVADGPTFKRLANVNADNTLHISTSLNAQGSVLPGQVILITFTMPDSATINATWTAQTPGRPDSSALTVPASNTTLGTNLIADGDGESATVGSQAASWTFDTGSGLLGANDFVHSGSKSLKIVNASASESHSHQDVSVTNGRVYSLQGWIKTTALSTLAGGGAVLNIDTVSGVTGFTIISKTGTDFSATQPDVGLPADSTARGFTFVQCLFKPIGSGVIRLFVQLGYIAPGVSGSAWFDDVGIFPTGASWTGLSASTGYYLYSYLDSITGVLNFANGNPPGTSPSDTLAMQCALDGRIPLAVKKVTTPTSGGSGSDTGGGSGTCPEFDGPAFVRRYSEAGDLIFEGEIKAGEVRLGYESDDGTERRGDLIKGYSFTQQKDVYRAVKQFSHVPCGGWMKIDGIRFTACETMYESGQWMPAWKVPGATQDNYSGYKILIQVEADWDDEHNYYIRTSKGLRLIHNSFILPC